MPQNDNIDNPSRYLTITQARKQLNRLAADPARETLILCDGVPAAVLVGIEAWRSMQDLLGLLRNPDELARGLAKHRTFQANQPVDTVSLEELDAAVTQDRSANSTAPDLTHATD